MQLYTKFYEAASNGCSWGSTWNITSWFLLIKLMFQRYVFVGSFNYFPTNILRDIYAHTHRVFNGGIKKTACSESLPKGGKWVNIQFKGHLESFGYSERIYALCGSEFF